MAEKTNVPEIRFAGFTDPWEQRKLGDVSKKVTTKNTDGALNETFTNSAERGIVSQLDYFDHDITNEANVNGYYVVRPNDFVYNPRISTIAPCGPINRNRLNRAGVMSPLYTVFSIDDGVCKTYLEHYFKTSRWHDFMFLEGNTGARSDRFSISDSLFFEMPIWCPSLAEQEAIAQQLELTDNLITLHQRKYDKLAQLKKSMLDKMFPKPGERFPEIRFAGFTDPWEQRKLGEITERYKELVATPQDGYTRMGVRSHAKGTFLAEVEPGQQIEERELSKVRANNLVVNIVFAWEHAVAITTEKDAKALVSHRFPQFSFHDDMEPDFFRYATLDPDFKNHLWLASPSGAGRNKTLNIKTMLEYKFDIPLRSEQARIAVFFQHLDSLITLHQRKLELLRNTKKSLLDRMFA